MKVKINKNIIVLDSPEVYIIKMRSPHVGVILFDYTVYTNYADAEAVVNNPEHASIRQWLEIETMYLD